MKNARGTIPTTEEDARETVNTKNEADTHDDEIASDNMVGSSAPFGSYAFAMYPLMEGLDNVFPKDAHKKIMEAHKIGDIEDMCM